MYVSLLQLSLLTLLESNFPGKPLGDPYGRGNSTLFKQDCARVEPSEIRNVSRGIGRTGVMRGRVGRRDSLD